MYYKFLKTKNKVSSSSASVSENVFLFIYHDKKKTDKNQKYYFLILVGFAIQLPVPHKQPIIEVTTNLTEHGLSLL